LNFPEEKKKEKSNSRSNLSELEITKVNFTSLNKVVLYNQGIKLLLVYLSNPIIYNQWRSQKNYKAWAKI